MGLNSRQRRRAWWHGVIAALSACVAVFVVWFFLLKALYRPMVLRPLDAADPPPSLKATIAGRPIVRILAIDGGGVRGIIPAMFLEELERRTGKPTSELFDFFAGTSTGSIVLCGLLTPDGRGNPRFTASEMVGKYESLSGKVLTAPWWRQAITLDGILAPRLSSTNKRNIFRKDIGAEPFGTLLKPAMFTAYGLKQAQPVFLKNWEDPWQGLDIADVMTAVTAVPAIFQAIELETSQAADPNRQLLIDSGLYQNSPALAAMGMILEISPRTTIVLVSLGTGFYKYDYPAELVQDWGEMQWADDLFGVITIGNSELVHRQLEFFESERADGHLLYTRINVRIPGAQANGFDASPENVLKLRHDTERFINENPTLFEKVSGMLTTDRNETHAPAPPSRTGDR